MPVSGFSNFGSAARHGRRGIEDSVNTTANAHHKHRSSLIRFGMPTMFAVVTIFAFGVCSCTRDTAPAASYDRNGDGRADEWQYRLGDGTIKVAIDTKADGHPDLIRTYRNGEMVKLERDRNLDGQTDWIEEYDHGQLARLTRDDNFDGKPDLVNTYRRGKLALVEHDPDACGSVDRTDYFDDSGKLIRTELRKR